MFAPTTRTINGICREGQTGTKWHKAVKIQESVEPGTTEYIKTGGWKTKCMYVVCQGQRSAGWNKYWGFIQTDDETRCTCKDCKPA